MLCLFKVLCVCCHGCYFILLFIHKLFWCELSRTATDINSAQWKQIWIWRLSVCLLCRSSQCVRFDEDTPDSNDELFIKPLWKPDYDLVFVSGVPEQGDVSNRQGRGLRTRTGKH